MLDDDRSHWTGATSIPSTSDGSSVVLIWGDNDHDDEEEDLHEHQEAVEQIQRDASSSESEASVRLENIYLESDEEGSGMYDNPLFEARPEEKSKGP